MGITIYPPAAQHKLGSPWVGPHQVVRQATGHTVGIQRDPDKPIIFVHVDDLKLCPGPRDVTWISRTNIWRRVMVPSMTDFH